MDINIDKLIELNQKDRELRPYQRKNKEQIYDSWRDCKSVMLQMPTGTGKTRLFVSLMRDIFVLGATQKIAYKILVLVHRTELIDQIDVELGIKYNLAHGIIQSGEKERKHYPLQIASVQTLSRRLDGWKDKDFDFIIVDEAHHITAENYVKIINEFPNAKLLGVTATPCRLSGDGFSTIFEKLILSPSIKDFIKKGYLSTFKYYSVAKYSYIQREIDKIKKVCNGDYALDELERICDNNKIRAQVIDTYIKNAKGKKGIVYTINKEHNTKLCTDFIANGFNAVALDSDTPINERKKYIDAFKRNEIDIICNVNLFTEGFDCPDIEFIQLARPTKSLSLFLQQIGRGLRKSESTNPVIILDNVGLYNKFGLPDSYRNWQSHFCNRKKEEKKNERILSNTTRKRHEPDLTEGREEVYIIKSPDDLSFSNERSECLWYIFDEFNTMASKLSSKIFESLKLKDAGYIYNGKYLYGIELSKQIKNIEAININLMEEYNKIMYRFCCGRHKRIAHEIEALSPTNTELISYYSEFRNIPFSIYPTEFNIKEIEKYSNFSIYIHFILSLDYINIKERINIMNKMSEWNGEDC